MHVLGVRVLHDIIREFARDSFPSNACNFVRSVVARFFEGRPWEHLWQERWEDHVPDPEWFLKKSLRRCFKLTFQSGEDRVLVKHFTIADEYVIFCQPHVKKAALRQAIIEAGIHPDSREGALLYELRHRAWLKQVKGRTWSATCSNDWHLRSEYECHIDVRTLRMKGYLYKEEDDLEHIVDLSTLTLVQR